MFAGKICFWANLYTFLWKKDSHEKEGITTKKIVRKKNWNHCAIHEEGWDRCFLYVVPVQTTMEYRAREQKIKITSKIHSLHEKKIILIAKHRENLFLKISAQQTFLCLLDIRASSFCSLSLSLSCLVLINWNYIRCNRE